MAGIAAASGSGPFGNAMSGINQAAQAAQAAKAQMQEGASGSGDLEGRVAQLESVQAGGAPEIAFFAVCTASAEEDGGLAVSKALSKRLIIFQ